MIGRFNRALFVMVLFMVAVFLVGCATRQSVPYTPPLGTTDTLGAGDEYGWALYLKTGT